MPKTRYVKCAKCRKLDKGRGGTATTMRCPDCCDGFILSGPGVKLGGTAELCRDCCPTGHGTRMPPEAGQHVR